MIQYCPSCGEKLEVGAAFCNECGTKIPDDPMLTCPKCGEKNKPKARFCKKCGDKIVHPSDMVICPDCDEVCYASAQFCMHCGEKFCWDEEDDDAPEDAPTDTYDPHEKIAGKDLSLKDVIINSVAKDSERMPMSRAAAVPKKKMPWKAIGIAALVILVLYWIGNYGQIAIIGSEIPNNEYTKECLSIPYENLARNPDKYANQKAVYTGKVAQVIEDGKKVALLVNVSEGAYGIWEDTIYVSFRISSTNEDRILEDDIITIYGEINGTVQYTTVLGVKKSVPHLKAKYVEID